MKKQPQGEEVLIDRKAFEEYQENEKKKTILIYKGLLTAFIAINIILISFIIIYRIQISAARSNINTLQTELNSQLETNSKLTATVNRKAVNLFSNVSVNKNLILELFNDSNEYETLMQWTNINKEDLFLCFKSTYDGDDPHLMRRYCDGDKLIVVIKAENGKRFGGFVSGVTFTKDVQKYETDKAFLFSLDNMKKFPIRNPSNAFIVETDGFFSFGNDIKISNGYRDRKVNSANFPSDYGDSSNTLEELTGGMRNFDIYEMEILTA